MGGQHRVVRLDHGGGNLWGWIYGQSQLRFLAVVDAQPLQKKRPQPGAGAPAHGIEDQETLESRAVVRELAHPVQALVDDLLTDYNKQKQI